MNSVWMIKDIKAYFIICRLAQKQKIKPGESMQKQFELVCKKHPEMFDHLGDTKLDKDLMLGNCRENGLKIFDLDEAVRRKNNLK